MKDIETKKNKRYAILIKTGKTKDVYCLRNGNVLLKFKDNITVGEDGREDPGGNKAGGTVQNLGKQSLELTKYYFNLIEKQLSIPTHMVDANVGESTMEVLPIKTFGNGLEWICRVKAEGSYLKRHKNVTRGTVLDNLVEVSLKDDKNNDPIFNRNAFVSGGKHNWQGNEIDLGNGVINSVKFDLCWLYTKKITKLIFDDFKKRNLELIDIKYEFGLDDKNRVILIDEISAGSMRVFDRTGRKLEKQEIYNAIIGDKKFNQSKHNFGKVL